MAMASVPYTEPANEELWDETSSLRVRIRRQAQQLKVQEDAIADLKATMANLTAAVAALVSYLQPRDGEWVYSEDGPPEYEEYEPSHRDYSRLLFQIPREVMQHGR